MKKETQQKIERILDFIEKDRLVPEDPFFNARLVAKTQGYFSGRQIRDENVVFHQKMQTAFALVAIVFGISIGIFSGTKLGSVKPREPVSARDIQLGKLADESFITEISNPAEEQLLKK